MAAIDTIKKTIEDQKNYIKRFKSSYEKKLAKVEKIEKLALAHPEYWDCRGDDLTNYEKVEDITLSNFDVPEEKATENNIIGKLIAIGGKEWKGGANHRVYFKNKVFFDMKTEKIIGSDSIEIEKIQKAIA